jgi:hypothetical protein
MKIKKFTVKFFTVLIVFISLFINACKREEWCVDCYWVCSFDPLTGPTSKTICAYSRQECEAEVQDFLDGRVLPDCWECSDPY